MAVDENELNFSRPYVQLMTPKKSDSISGLECEVTLDDDISSVGDSNFGPNYFYDDDLLIQLNKLTTTASEDPVLEYTTESFEEMRKGMTKICEDGGVVKKVLKSGVGHPLISGTRVKFHYTCYLEFSDEPFDSSHWNKRMPSTKLGEGELLPGLTIALSSMKLKEKSMFLVSPEYGFGQVGCPPRIPAAATLLYIVTLESVLDPAEGEETTDGDWNWDQRRSAPFEEKLASARSYHKKGNHYYREGNLHKSLQCYQRSLTLMENSPLKDEQQEQASHSLQLKLHSNLAKVHLDLEEPIRACTQCRLALDLPCDIPKDMKAKIFFRYGIAKVHLNAFSDAREFLFKTEKLRPNCPNVAKYLEKVNKREKKHLSQEKYMCKRMFESMDGNTTDVDSDD